MTVNRMTRYCRCGARLARDNPASRCATCHRNTLDLTARPPDVPDEFWQTPQLHDAFAAQHIGQVSRAYRKHPKHVEKYGKDGIPQEIVAGWLGLTQAQVSRIENGSPTKHLDNLAHWARALRIPEHLLWFKMLDTRSDVDRNFEPGNTHRSDVPTQRSVTNRATQAPTGPALLGRRQREGIDTFTSAMHSFRAADKQVGGGHLYATVVKYLQAEVAPKLVEIGGGDDGKVAFTAAAALTEMAGWMAHDAGRDEAAEHHFGRSLGFVKVGGDRQLGVHVLASMSHLAHHRRKPVDAIRFAQRGRRLLARGPRHPELEARVLAMEACGFAALRKTKECTKLLLDAERTLVATPREERSRWTSTFDEGSLASTAARCLRQLGDLTEAARQAERIIELRQGGQTRSRAFGQLILATVLIAQGRLGEACALTREILDATQQLGSYLVIKQLVDLKKLLSAHRHDRSVAEFLTHLDEALRERMWLYEWLTRDGSQEGGRTEKW